jgi:uncharacterized membrane protein YeaQ/YmgE (transglycosylase-associated protein family)
MLEQVAQMGPLLVVAGLMTGWAAEAFARTGGYGLIPDMIVGALGSLLLGAVVLAGVSPGAGMLTMFVIGGAGAGLAVVVQRSLWRSVRPAA